MFCMPLGVCFGSADEFTSIAKAGGLIRRCAGKLIKLSSTGVFQLLVATASWTALMPIMAGFGEVAIAGYVIALRVVMFALLPALGLSNAAATMVGQNLGAGKPERAEAAVWKAAWFNAAFYFVIGLIFYFSHIRSSAYLRRSLRC